MANGELLIDEKGEVVEQNNYPFVIRLLANFFSYIFHPLFIPLFAAWFLVFVHPSYFVGYGPKEKIWILVRVAYTMVFFPLVTVFLLKGLGFIDSIFLKTQRDRIIPYIASGIFFFWAYLVFRNQPEIPTILTSFAFAVFISSSAALMANIYFKISMHGIGMGGLLGVFIVLVQQNSMWMAVPLSIAFLITGLVCTSRLIVSNHTPKEIYAGLVIGIICQLVAAAMYL